MKKLFTLFAVLAVAVITLSAQAQYKEVIRVPAGEHLVKFGTENVEGDLDAAGESILRVFDLGKKTKVQYYTIPVYIDSLAYPAADAGEEIPVVLQESFDNVTWLPLDTVDFYVSDSDTTFNFQDLTTGTSAPWLRVYFDGTDADSVQVTVKEVWGRFLDK